MKEPHSTGAGAMKKALRRGVLCRRDALPSSARTEASRAIMRKFISLPEYLGSKTVMFFVSFGSEVSTMDAIRDALASGRRAAVPKADKAGRKLAISAILDPEADLAPGAYGIPEPVDGRTKPVNPSEIDLVMMPGAAFDDACNRLGYGGGYYDSFLPTLRPGVPRIAAAFEIQIVDRVPVEEHDLKVDAVVTEKRIIRRKRMQEDTNAKD